MRIFLVGELPSTVPEPTCEALRELGARHVAQSELTAGLTDHAPALLLLALDATGVASVAADLARTGSRFESALIAVIDTASDADSALDAGADDVFVGNESAAALHARIRAATHHLAGRIAFTGQLGASVEVSDGAGRLQYVNPAFEALTGYGLDEVRGRFVADLSDDEPSRLALGAAWGHFEEDGFWTGTLPVRFRSGRGQQHELTLSAVRRRDGAVAYVVGQRRDVTERVVSEEQVRLLEAELRRTEHLATVGTLAAGVAHEINNPLTYVISNVSLVLDSLRSRDLPGEVEALSDAMEGCERVKRIVADLRLFSRNSADELEVVELEPVLESAANIAASELRQRARLVRDFANIPPVRATRARLGQVFLNLISNAAHAIAPGHANENEVRLRTGVGDDGWVFVEVSDTGSGMEPEVLARVFEPFFTTKAPGLGTGLGLSLSHGIVTSLGGVLSATSVVGQGSTFRIELLPAPRSSLFLRSATRSLVPNAPRRARVLVIDDEPQVGRAMRRTLSEHEVIVAEGPDEGRAALLNQPAFDAVFCDVIMPVTSGIDLFLDPAIATCATPRACWVFMSGGTRDRRLGEFLQRVANPFLAKPCGPREVLAALARAQSAPVEAAVGARPTVPAAARSSGAPH